MGENKKDFSNFLCEIHFRTMYFYRAHYKIIIFFVTPQHNECIYTAVKFLWVVYEHVYNL